MNSSNKKPLSKLLTRETSSLSNPSFRVYYGKASGSVPFLWESQPGTPKHPTTTNPNSNDQYALQPLTPPPSFCYYAEPSKKKAKSHNLLHIILPKLNLRRDRMSYRSNSSSSCSSSELSSPAVGQTSWQRGAATARLSSPKAHLFSSEEGKEEDEPYSLMLCFGPWRRQ